LYIRKVWLVVIGLLVIGILPGCGRKNDSSGPPPKGRILLWHWMTDREEVFQRLADQYQKQTGIRVTLELYAPSDTYASKVRASAQTNTLPDIFGVLDPSPRDLASYINSGHIADLTSVLAADHRAWQNTFFQKALASVHFIEGNSYGITPGIYGIPIDVANIQILYNKTMFRQVGLNPERPPQTWDEFIAAWHRLKAAGLPGLVSGWGELWMIDCFANSYAFNLMGESKVFDTFRGKVPYTDPDWVAVLGIFETIRKEGLLVDGAVTMVNKTAEQTFANGKAAFALNGSWSVDVYRGMNPDLSFGVMLPPRMSDHHPMRIWGGAGSSFIVNAHSPQKDEAIRFLRWLTAVEQQNVLAGETLNLPANRASTAQLPPVLGSFASRMNLATQPTHWPVSENPTVTEAFDRGIQSILIGEKTPAQVAAEVEKLRREQTMR
jgi:ABC-type glycerol-3-phosphate transport system substrate-binding protein